MRVNVVGMIGGLGNQLFQFAFGQWLESATNRKTVYDLSAYRTIPSYFSLGSLDVALLPLRKSSHWYPHPSGKYPALARGIRKLVTPSTIVLEAASRTGPTPQQLARPAWYYGYWQSALTTIPSIFPVRKALLTAAPVLATESAGIAIHVRRGDMVGKSGAVDRHYFSAAWELLKGNHGLSPMTPVRIFSDDPEWCKKNLDLPSASHEPQRTAFEDLTDMASFEYLILSGSTFSWWAANLRSRNPATVVTPSPIIPGFDPHLQNPGWLLVSR
jgi:hypothetical protein